MAYKRVLTVQDISCVGQCSMTVALPILSACGAEACILPTALLSSHTGGFQQVHKRDLSCEIPDILACWEREGLRFDIIYTGYLGSVEAVSYVLDMVDKFLAPEGTLIVDPAMADHGKLYKGLSEAYAEAMRALCRKADILIPNVTEGCMLAGWEFPNVPDAAWAEMLTAKLLELGICCTVLTGVGGTAEKTGVTVFADGMCQNYSHDKTPQSYHGTGDMFAAAFVGAYTQGKSVFEAAKIAADFTALAILNTYMSPAHWYGVKFETALPRLLEMLK